MLLRRAAQPPNGGEVTGDMWINTTDGKTYQWDGDSWEFIGTASHDNLDDVSANDHHSAFTIGDHAGIEHLASMLAIEVRPWTSNFNVAWDDVTPDYNELFYGKAGAETDTDADITFADGTTDLINFSTENGVPDGLWYLYWDDTEKTGDDYDVQRTDDVLVATGVGKGLLATVLVDNAGSNPPCVIPWGGYKPYISAGVMAARFITAGMLKADFVIGDLEIKTGAGVQWAASGDPGVIITDAGFRGKGAAGAIMVELLSADGKITGGGGSAIIDDWGITILGEALRFYGVGTLQGIIHGREVQNDLTITAYEDMDINVLGGGATLGDLTLNAQGSVKPPLDAARDLGLPGAAWRYYAPRTNLAGRPAAAAGVVGLFWGTREGAGNKEILWWCAQNDANGYEWVQVGITT